MTWEQSRLWLLLAASETSSPDADDIRDGVAPIVRAAEKILAKGGTQPSSFTLHDEEHAFRVAERMAELAPPPVLTLLTHYELALLLASAYLHDIGMAPQGALLNGLRRIFLGEDAPRLAPDIVDALSAWQDEQADDVSIPIASDHPHRAEAAEQAVARFVRDSHNDWSERWIEERTPASLGQYVNWRDDLVRLCRSHHEGQVELSSGRFDARLIGSLGTRVNLRYLAMLLRLADVCEVDPERTPPVILEHRLIDPASVSYWTKDQHMSLRIGADGSIVVHARPPSAVIHRAVIETADGIDAELTMCRRLVLDGLATKMPAGTDSRYTWPYEAAVDRDIKEGGQYHYIDGAFRPNTRKLLELLGGTELYDDPVVAVRELLQNAFDAVREEIAWTRLQRPTHFSTVHELEALALTHRVDLELTTGPEPRLVCRDSGVGMNARILRDHLLVSGSARRPDAARLERLARAAAFTVGRTGRFGIGVLSYFMLAERVWIDTRRSPKPRDGEAHGWTFQTRGVGSFGELRPSTASGVGTEISLELRAERVMYLATALQDRLEQWVAHVPCRFVTSIDGNVVVDTGPGFTFLPRRPLAENAADPRLSWRSEEGELPGGMGSYRLDVPVWRVEGSLALARVSCGHEGRDLVVGRRIQERPHDVVVAWRGMAARTDRWDSAEPWHGSQTLIADAAAVVNLTSDDAGAISVDRAWLSSTSEGLEAIRFVRRQLKRLRVAIASEESPGTWVLLNHRLADSMPPAMPEVWQWLVEPTTHDRAGRWAEVRFPALQALGRTVVNGMLGLAFRGERLSSAVPLVAVDRTSTKRFEWHADDWSPDVIAAYEGRPIGIFLVPPQDEGRHRAPGGSAFPPEWSDLAGFRVDDATGTVFAAFNRENVLVQRSYFDGTWGAQAAPLLTKSERAKRRDLDAVLMVAEKRPRLLASWLLLALAGELPTARERSGRDPAWWSEVWSRLGIPESTTVLFWSDTQAIQGLQVLNRNSWQFRDLHFTTSGMATLPKVHKDWAIQKVL